MREPGVSRELLAAEEFTRRHGGVIIKRRDGFVIVYKQFCWRARGCVPTLLWFRSSPVTRSGLRYLRSLLKSLSWKDRRPEVWLVRLYREPERTEEYRDLVDRALMLEELLDCVDALKNRGVLG